MIVDLLNFCRYYPGTEAEILFHLQEKRINMPHFFCITENSSEDELNNYLQNHFQHTDRFFVRLSLSLKNAGIIETTETSDIDLSLKVIPKSALSYTADKLFSEAKAFLKKNYPNQNIDEVSLNIIVQEVINLPIRGDIYTVCKDGPLNETLIHINNDIDIDTNEKIDTVYCHNNTDGILFGYEPEGTKKAKFILIKNLLEISEEIKKVMKGTELDIKFISDSDGEKINIISIKYMRESKDGSSKIISLDTKGICRYYPGITEPLTASIATAIAKKTIEYMLIYSGLDKKLSDDFIDYSVYVNGRMYFDLDKVHKLQSLLYLNSDADEFIDLNLLQIIKKLRYFRSISKLNKKHRIAKKTTKLLGENLKRREKLCNEMRSKLDNLSDDLEDVSDDEIIRSIETILFAFSKCINANQLNTFYIELNRKMIKRNKITDKKYKKLTNIIDTSLLFQTELRKYQYNFQRLLNKYHIHMGQNLAKKGLIEKSEDIFMLTSDELMTIYNTPAVNVKSLIQKRRAEFKWYKSMPGFSRLLFVDSIKNAPLGEINIISTVTDKSYIRGSGVIAGKAEYKAVLCKDNMIPQNCESDKIYIINKFNEFPIDIKIGGLIIMERQMIANMNPDIISKITFPVICGAEHADSIIHENDIVSINGDTGDIFIKHKI